MDCNKCGQTPERNGGIGCQCSTCKKCRSLRANNTGYCFLCQPCKVCNIHMELHTSNMLKTCLKL